jgi:hypothetical protein
MKQKYFEKTVLNQKEIDEFWKNLTSGNREKGVVPMAADIEPTKKFVERIDKWIISNQSHIAKHENIRIESIQYNEDLSECVVVYER